MLLLALTLLGLFGISWGQDANCDYLQNVQPGQSIYINNPEYPNKYAPGVNCRWIANCPSGYNCKLNCQDIELPQSQGCSMDKLLVSLNGDPQLANAEVYCGTGELTQVSDKQTISVGLKTSSTSPGGRFACEVTAQLTSLPSGDCRCGYKKTNRIVGGRVTDINEFPMMAILVDVTSFKIACGATIISPRHVLTAAHCVDRQPTSKFAVVVGEHNIDTADSSATQAFSLVKSKTHPRFDPQTRDYDIAVLKTNQPIPFSDRVGPACLPFKFVNKNFEGATVTAIGYGNTDSFPFIVGGSDSKVPRKVDLQVTSKLVCQASRPLFLTTRQICTFALGKGACQDDSGGPLLYQDNTTGLLFLLGIIGTGPLCATVTSDVNTRVTEFLDFILSETDSYQFCRK